MRKQSPWPCCATTGESLPVRTATSSVHFAFCHPDGSHFGLHSYRAGVQHDPHHRTEALGRQVVPELCPHDARVAYHDPVSLNFLCSASRLSSWTSRRSWSVHTMCPRHLAPDHPYLAAPDLPLAAVDERDALAQIEAGVLGVVHALCSLYQYVFKNWSFRRWVVAFRTDCDEARVGVGVPLAALVREVLAPVRSILLAVLSFITALPAFPITACLNSPPSAEDCWDDVLHV